MLFVLEMWGKMKRIKYRKIGENRFQSTSSFPHATNGGVYHIILDLTGEPKFEIWEETSNTKVCYGFAVSEHKVKIAAKNSLVNLGFLELLDIERRNVIRSKKNNEV